MTEGEAPDRTRARSPYLSLASAALQRALAYRSARLIGVLTGLVVLSIQYVMWKNVFAVRTQVGAFGWEAMQTYVVLTFALGGLLPNEYEIGFFRSIQLGEVALELVRPIDFQRAQLATASGAGLAELCFRGMTALVIGTTLFGAAAPSGGSAALLFPISVLLGFVVRFLITYLIGLCCFWLLNIWGLQSVRYAVTHVLSGAAAPLSLLPGGLRQIALHSPFAGMVSVPTSIYLGQLSGGAALRAVLIQLAWVIGLWLVARRLWAFSLHKFVVQGG